MIEGKNRYLALGWATPPAVGTFDPPGERFIEIFGEVYPLQAGLDYMCQNGWKLAYSNSIPTGGSYGEDNPDMFYLFLK